MAQQQKNVPNRQNDNLDEIGTQKSPKDMQNKKVLDPNSRQQEGRDEQFNRDQQRGEFGQNRGMNDQNIDNRREEGERDENRRTA